MADEPEVSPAQSLQSQYESQFTNHLTENRAEQARLRERLEQLVADEAWLVRALEAVSAPAEAGVPVPGDGSARPQDNASAPAEPAEATEPSEASGAGAFAAVPKQRQDKPARTRAQKTTAKKTAAKKATAKKTAPKQTPVAKQAPAAKKTAAKAGEPSLGELLLAVLGRHTGQPRTAGEVAGDLEREYPERARDGNTVRNTLERLVAKGRVERVKQKNTVLYTAVAEPAAGVEAAPAVETAGAEESENAEKVPAQA
ncbi:BlaI/MecI/CopY family transcriptional regulator [Streptomyces viridosporus]|uniref:BlaI/MecI/CopY family transcriptional regulator n=1 Tax=Streptomyces viridosporus TaxID=67581 RepID=UPI00332BDDC3